MSSGNPTNNLNSYLADPDVTSMLEFQKGDKASFEKLMAKYYPRILNFIYRFVGNREMAEDLTQEVFIRVYHSAASYQPQSKFQTWVYTIAKNISLNELRRHKGKFVSLDEPQTGEEEGLPRQLEDTKTLDPSQEILQQEKLGMIKAAIQSLPENQRMAVILRRYDDFSYEEIAYTMNLSLEAVKSLLNRAKENLKNKLAGLEKG